MTPQASACEDRRWLKSISVSHYDYNDQPSLLVIAVADQEAAIRLGHRRRAYRNQQRSAGVRYLHC
jgi:hypothetical protein